jgi:hypothetical protein
VTEIIFDPSKVPITENFMKEENYFEHDLTRDNLIMWQEKQSLWEKLGAQGRTDINANVEIYTNLIQSISIQVKAFLTKPSIVQEENLDYGLV